MAKADCLGLDSKRLEGAEGAGPKGALYTALNMPLEALRTLGI
ncbi:MAG: hypothetical protein QW371_03215 [Candidatus Bathyarchaeia archaeon]